MKNMENICPTAKRIVKRDGDAIWINDQYTTLYFHMLICEDCKKIRNGPFKAINASISNLKRIVSNEDIQRIKEAYRRDLSNADLVEQMSDYWAQCAATGSLTEDEARSLNPPLSIRAWFAWKEDTEFHKNEDATLTTAWWNPAINSWQVDYGDMFNRLEAALI